MFFIVFIFLTLSSPSFPSVRPSFKSFPSVLPVSSSSPSLFCVWPWLTGHWCSALQPIPLGPVPCRLFSDLDSLSLSLRVALSPPLLSTPPPPSVLLSHFFNDFFLFFFRFPFFFSSHLVSLFLLLCWCCLCAPCWATMTAFSHPSRSNPPIALCPLIHLLSFSFFHHLTSQFFVPSLLLPSFVSPDSQRPIYIFILTIYNINSI